MDRKLQNQDSKATLSVYNNYNAKTLLKAELLDSVYQPTLLNNLSAKSSSAILKLIAIVSLFILVNTVQAQVTTVKGPSDAVSSPPASASSVSQVLASNSNIALKIGTASPSADVIYQWYKMDNTGTKRLVQNSNSPTLSETPSGAGYYTYQLVVSNSNQCSSEISDPFKVYVLPALQPTIAASSSTVCTNGTSTSLLTANPGSDKYSYQYQWMLNGGAISGATGSTYTTPGNISNGDNTFTVKVAYVLSTTTTGTANQVVTAVPVPVKPTVTVGQ